MQYLWLTFQECMQTPFQKMARIKITAYTHTAFLKIFRVVHEEKYKKCLRNWLLPILTIYQFQHNCG